MHVHFCLIDDVFFNELQYFISENYNFVLLLFSYLSTMYAQMRAHRHIQFLSNWPTYLSLSQVRPGTQTRISWD